MSFKTDIESAIDELEIDLRHEDGSLPSFDWKGATIPCIPSSLEAGNVIVVGGKEEQIVFTLHVRRAQFLTADSTIVYADSELITSDNTTPTPITGKTLTFRGKARRILTVTEDSSKAYLRIVLGSVNQ